MSGAKRRRKQHISAMLVSAHLPYTKKNTKDSYDTNQLPISDSEKVGTMSGQFKISKEASLILVKQQTEQNILNCYIYLNGNENSQNIPLIGEAGVVEVERLQSQQIKIIHGKCMLRCRTIPLIGEALLGMLEMELEDQMPSLM
ncbi:unnamed protein product [Miscanthus lutarioriparius]|uniref:Uncharacterized protein n=1 Tax=Miscanthus lutarioriparius TaxID=422564 RepID=A0A811PPY5_9POAL|nr:unnamed protein product [Miscanthus lutarioriparius]